MLTAIVNGNGKRNKAGIETLYLHFNKKLSSSLPDKVGRKVPIQIVLGGVTYSGILGSRSDYSYIYVSTQLVDPDGTKRKLADVLKHCGISKGDRLSVKVRGNHLTVIG